MEAQVIRYRATRRHVFGVLNIGEFECFVMERRSNLLDAGAYAVTLSDYNNVVRIGDTVATHNRFATDAGSMRVGCTICDNQLTESEATGRMLVAEIAKGLKEDSALNLEVIDEADYEEADSGFT